jgi:hypothetical protein
MERSPLKTPYGDVVLFGAGEVVQGGAEAFRFDHAQVHLQAVAQDDGGAGGPLGEDLLHLVVMDEVLDHRFWFACRHQDIQVAHRFLAATVTAGDDDLHDLLGFTQITYQ